MSYLYVCLLVLTAYCLPCQAADQIMAQRSLPDEAREQVSATWVKRDGQDVVRFYIHTKAPSRVIQRMVRKERSVWENDDHAAKAQSERYIQAMLESKEEVAKRLVEQHSRLFEMTIEWQSEADRGLISFYGHRAPRERWQITELQMDAAYVRESIRRMQGNLFGRSAAAAESFDETDGGL